MNIWIIHHYANTPDTFGDARHFSHARELISRGHRVRIVACSFHHLMHKETLSASVGQWENTEHKGVSFTWIRTHGYQKGSFRRVLNMFEFCLRVMRRDWAAGLERPDLIMGSTPHPFAPLAAERLAAHYRVPFVLEVRDAWPYVLTEVGGYSKTHPFIQLVDKTMRFLYWRASAIIMFSMQSSDLLAGYGADPKKIVWIPHGVDLTMSPKPRSAPDDGVFTVTYIGAHNRWNALETILKAAKIIQESQIHNILIRFVGDGECKPSLISWAERTSLQNVRFDDSVPKIRLYEVLHESDAFIINSRKDEVSRSWMSFSKLYICLAAGRPVIFGSCTSSDPVRDSGAGVSVTGDDSKALANAIRFMASCSAEELERYGKLGRAHIESNYSIPVLVDRFEAVIYKVTGLQSPVTLHDNEAVHA
jgi:glycosyltransferase involved in cell wall biosynthesis